MENSGPIIHVLGTVGSGKGTQVAKLTKQFGIPAISAGDLFRQTAEQPTPFGRRVKAILVAGSLMTIDIWDEIIRTYLLSADFSKGYLLDGVVRTLEQVTHFEQILQEMNLQNPWVLAIDVPEAVAFERILKRGRADTDTEEATRKRLAWSREQTKAVIDYYLDQHRVISVDGNQPVEDVYRDIVAGLESHALLPGETE